MRRTAVVARPLEVLLAGMRRISFISLVTSKIIFLCGYDISLVIWQTSLQVSLFPSICSFKNAVEMAKEIFGSHSCSVIKILSHSRNLKDAIMMLAKRRVYSGR